MISDEDKERWIEGEDIDCEDEEDEKPNEPDPEPSEEELAFELYF